MGHAARDHRTAAARMVADGRVVGKSLFAHNAEQMGRVAAVDSRRRQQREGELLLRIGGGSGHHHLALGRNDHPVVVEKPQFEIEAFSCVLLRRGPEPAVLSLRAPEAPDLVGVVPVDGGVHHVLEIDVALDAGDGVNDFGQSHLQHRRNGRRGANRSGGGGSRSGNGGRGGNGQSRRRQQREKSLLHFDQAFMLRTQSLIYTRKREIATLWGRAPA